MKTSKSVILAGVETFQKRGYPGTIVVYGDDAEVLVTGKKDEDVIVATSQLEKGRVVAFSHDQYGKEIYDLDKKFDNDAFYENVRKWVSKKESGIKICLLRTATAIDSIEDLKKYDILISTGNEKTSEKLVEQYVKEGGGFIQAITPWGWLQLNPKQSIIDIPYSNLLKEAGLSFWDGVVYDKNLKIAKIYSEAVEHKRQEELKSVIYDAGFISKLIKLPLTQCLAFKPTILKIWEEFCSLAAPLCTNEKVCSKNRFEKIVLDTWCNLSSLQDNKTLKARGIKNFPGDYDTLPPRKSTTVFFNSSLKDIHVTSCHIPAGCVAYLKVTFVKGAWKAILGAHTDCLTDNVCRRWPRIFKEIELEECKTYELTHPFGGSIYLLSPDDDDAEIKANIDDVVLCPRYDIKKPHLWEETKHEPGLWADLSGKYTVFTFPSKSVTRLHDPKLVLELYDRLLECYHDLKGTDIDEHRKMWVVSDEQPSAGYMHAGYPIVTHLDVTQPDSENFLLNYKSFLEGKFWGIFHEMGHNMQEAAWTFEGTSEVTVNIFTLYGMHKVCKQPTLTHPWLKNNISATKQYLQQGANFEVWQSKPGVALFVYAQLAYHFSWDSYKAVFRVYNDLTSNPSSLQEAIDLWFVTFSKQVEKDLSPWTDFWGIPFSETARKQLIGFPSFLPNDAVFELDVSRLEKIKKKYQGRLC